MKTYAYTARGLVVRIAGTLVKYNWIERAQRSDELLAVLKELEK